MKIERQELGLGVYQAWLFDGQVILHGVTGYSRETTDHFIASMKVILEGWEQQKPYYAIVDLTEAAFTIYAQAKMRLFFQAMPRHLDGLVVPVLPDTIVGQLLRVFAQRFAPRQLPQHFTNQLEDALRLFEERLTRI
jgi:hypothetical protein